MLLLVALAMQFVVALAPACGGGHVASCGETAQCRGVFLLFCMLLSRCCCTPPFFGGDLSIAA
jgi:hypothetical protein